METPKPYDSHEHYGENRDPKEIELDITTIRLPRIA